MPASDIVVVGRIGSPYGVAGWVHIRSFTDPPSNLRNYQPWLLSTAETGPWAASPDVEVKRNRDGLVAKFVDVADRDAVGRMRGYWIGVDSDLLAQSAHDEYLWRDLMGCVVVTAGGVELGVVDHLLATGAHDVMVLTGRGAKRLIPFVDRYVSAVDLAARRIEVDWDPDWS